jgi:hypothetical protein
MDWIDLLQDKDHWRGSCEHANEPSGSITCWSSRVVAHLAASQVGLSSMKLIKKLIEFWTDIGNWYQVYLRQCERCSFVRMLLIICGRWIIARMVKYWARSKRIWDRLGKVVNIFRYTTITANNNNNNNNNLIIIGLQLWCTSWMMWSRIYCGARRDEPLVLKTVKQNAGI